MFKSIYISLIPCLALILLVKMRPSRQLLSLKYLTSAVPKQPIPSVSLSAHKQKVKPQVDLNKLVWDAYDLNSYFKILNYEEPLGSQLVKADTLFHDSRTKHEWTCSLFSDIPDVKVKRLEEERHYKLDLVEPYKWNEYHSNLLNSRTSFGVEPLMLVPLPEVLFVGHTNAGKSSLINNVFARREKARIASSETGLAFESRQAGFTKCLICFNVNSRLRLIDTPGYGERSIENQGSLVLDYIQQRKQLKKTYIVIDGSLGCRPEDELVMDHLQQNKTPFEIVFTKLDEVVKKKFSKEIIKRNVLSDEKTAHDLATDGNSRVVEHFLRVMEEASLSRYSMLKGVLFNNSRTNNILKKRSGYRELRGSIVKTCGL